jgi:hypothetical protein
LRRRVAGRTKQRELHRYTGDETAWSQGPPPEEFAPPSYCAPFTRPHKK